MIISLTFFSLQFLIQRECTSKYEQLSHFQNHNQYLIIKILVFVTNFIICLLLQAMLLLPVILLLLLSLAIVLHIYCYFAFIAGVFILLLVCFLKIGILKFIFCGQCVNRCREQEGEHRDRNRSIYIE